jgi:hypothetical protein
MRQSNRRRPRTSSNARYDSLASFYTADPRRARSRERDVGLWWREDVGGPLHRAAWVADTGELYLVRLGPADEGGGAVEVLAQVGDRDRLERALRGWRERCGERRSLGWLRARAARLSGERREDRVRPETSAPAGRAGAGAPAILAAISSVASELAYKSRPRARATASSARPSTSRLAPGISLPAR